jgi:hypothetical protein
MLRRIERLVDRVARLQSSEMDGGRPVVEELGESHEKASEMPFDPMDPFDQWLEAAFMRDDVQMHRWTRYFKIRDKMTSRDIQVAKRLENGPIALGFAYDEPIAMMNQTILEWKGRSESNVDMEEDQERMEWRTLSDSGGLKGFFPFNVPMPDSDSESEHDAPQVFSFLERDGGLSTLHAHVIPALFIQNHLAALKNPAMDFHVMCHGFRYRMGKNELWGWTLSPDWYGELVPVRSSNEHKLALSLLDSQEFQNILTQPSTKSVRRICIWLMIRGHVAMLCWDEYRLPDETHHIFAICDNLIDGGGELNYKNFMLGFETALEERHIAVGEPRQWNNSACCPYQMKVEHDFLCSSFMARYTVMLSVFESFFYLNYDARGKFADLAMGEIKWVYRNFEIDLFCFITDMAAVQKIVLFSPSLDAAFLNIDSVSLVVMDVNGSCTSYKYDGKAREFIESSEPFSTSESCVVMSRMDSPPRALNSYPHQTS